VTTQSVPRIIPLFPLPNVVFFPKMPLPLHLFELRYRKMAEDALAGDKVIGMVLLKPGYEADYDGRPPVYPVGCAGVVEQSERLRDGRYNLVLRGLCRFRVGREYDEEPYRRALVEPLADELGDEARLASLRGRLLAAIGQAGDGPSALVLQNELPPETFVNALSQTLALSPLERQSLLDCDSVLARGDRLVEILEFQALEQKLGRGKAVH
jgi:hypothetical protein